MLIAKGASRVVTYAQPVPLRILGNVIANAYTFTSVGFVRVKIESAPSSDSDGLTPVTFVSVIASSPAPRSYAVLQTISDTGTGMTENFVKDGQIFAPFVQACVLASHLWTRS